MFCVLVPVPVVPDARPGQVCHPHTPSPSLPRCCCSKLDSLEYAHSTFWRDTETVRLTEVPGTSPCVDLVFTWQSPGEVPVVTVVPCDDVRQCRVRGEVRGDVSVSTGRVEPHYWEHLSPLHHTRVTWWRATTLTHHVRLQAPIQTIYVHLAVLYY